MQRVLIVFFVMAVVLFIVAFFISMRSSVEFAQEKLDDQPPCPGPPSQSSTRN